MSDQNAALFDKLDGFYVTKSEHDWLERRFSNMTEKEKILFQGAMELEKPQEIGHVMRIASQLDCYDLFYGAGDEAALGKFVMESIECSSDAARPFLNAEHLGAAYHQSQNGAFCNGHYVRLAARIPASISTQTIRTNSCWGWTRYRQRASASASRWRWTAACPS